MVYSPPFVKNQTVEYEKNDGTVIRVVWKNDFRSSLCVKLRMKSADVTHMKDMCIVSSNSRFQVLFDSTSNKNVSRALCQKEVRCRCILAIA